MKEWIDARAVNVGIAIKIKLGIKKRMRGELAKTWVVEIPVKIDGRRAQRPW
jgi:hypothetical protein